MKSGVVFADAVILSFSNERRALRSVLPRLRTSNDGSIDSDRTAGASGLGERKTCATALAFIAVGTSGFSTLFELRTVVFLKDTRTYKNTRSVV